MANLLVFGFLALSGTYLLLVRSTDHHPPLISLGLALLAGTWYAIYWTEWLFTQAHLVGYYCCVQPQDLPPIGTLARSISDFFRSSPGQHLLAASFVLASGLVSLYRLRTVPSPSQVCRFLLISNLLYLLMSIMLSLLGWQISTWVNGVQETAYKDIARTWYGLVLHLLLWVIYLWTLIKVRLPPWKQPGTKALSAPFLG